MNRTILHIDFDGFFASVAQQDNPLLRGKPVGVTAAHSRTCIIAASREAKAMGVKGGMPSYIAYKLCPYLLLSPATFVRYFEINKQFIKICNDFSPLVEVFSIDELFMDVTLTSHLFGGVYPLITKLKERIRQEIGVYITVSVGIAPNKMLAKMASGLKKPDGVFEVKAHQVASLYQIAALTDVCGIGSRIEKRLNQMGIYSLINLSKVPLVNLIAEFGNVEGQFLYNVGQGQDTAVVKSYGNAPDTKSVGRNYCLPRNEYDTHVVLQNIYELSEEVCLKLRRLKKQARGFGVSLRGTHIIEGHLLHDYYSHRGSDMFASIVHILKNKAVLFDEGYVRQISVWASYLKDRDMVSVSLLPKDQKWERIIPVIDNINERFGDHTIRNGFLLGGAKLTTVPNGFLADRENRQEIAKLFP